MGLILIELLIVAVLVALAIFIAVGDRRIRQIRAEEDRLKALEKERITVASNDAE